MNNPWTKITVSILLLHINLFLFAQSSVPDFPWIKDTGAKSFPSSQKIFNVDKYGAVGDGMLLNTQAIQKAIDDAEAAGGGTVTFSPGIYLTGSVFVGNNVNFHIPKGTMLIGSQNIDDYKKIETRIAGVEMQWPAALINMINKKNAAISGDGVINGKGKVFWDKYWRMRKEYDPKGLRWIVDYDCERPRGILISGCENATVKDIVLYQAGFWSIHILYSRNITVDGVIISNNIEGHGPSTDGIDIDSSSFVEIKNSNINCNDDNFCLKAGRDWDGLRVNKPCEYILIHDCTAGLGDGLFTCGSETSGGIRHIVAYNMKATGTSYGLRFKSTTKRGGIIEDIHLYNVEMTKVEMPVIFDLNWYPAYSNSTLPTGYDASKIPQHWKKMLATVDPKQGTPKFRNINFVNVRATDAKICFQANGIESSTLDNFTFQNVILQGEEAGKIDFYKDWDMAGLKIEAPDTLTYSNQK
ncbi:MAG TPA: glycosyl hydrolase family 28 protein [Bacteroidales bacterium]|nr:glycosyl hydrolase family 28 protein [Bacteroidales bacterium]